MQYTNSNNELLPDNKICDLSNFKAFAEKNPRLK